MDTLAIQSLLERLSGLLRTETRNLLLEYGLQPVQFEALHYLTICNRYSDTPMGVTDYLGQTKGTVSQTIKVLEKKGLVLKVPDIRDKRVSHLSVTTQGNQLVKKMLPSPMLRAALEQYDCDESGDIEEGLTALLRNIQRQNQFKSFGQCLSCVHNKQSETSYYCGLTKEPLSVEEITLICREHETG